MEDFYQAWLAESERIEKAVSEGLRVARGKDLEWTRTRQDAKAALMIAPEKGFTTALSSTGSSPTSWLKAAIPLGSELAAPATSSATSFIPIYGTIAAG